MRSLLWLALGAYAFLSAAPPSALGALDGGALLAAARKAEEAKALKKALSLYQRAAGLPQWQETGTLGASRIMLNLQEFDQAQGALLEYLEANPFSIAARIALAEVFLRQKDPARAVKEIEKVESFRPKHPQAWLRKAQAYLQLEKVEDAEFAASTAIDQPQGSTWEAHLVRARALVALKSWTRAEKDARKVIDERPQDSEGHEILGDALLAQGKLQEAEGAIRIALKLDPMRSQAIARLARVTAAQGKTDAATSLYREAISRGAGDADLELELAQFLISSKRDEDAGDALKKLLNAQPTHEEALRSLIHLLARHEQLDASVPHIKAYIAAQPGTGWVHLAYAKLLLGVDRPADAQVQLEQVAQQERDKLPEWGVYFAACRVKQDDLLGAVRALEEAHAKSTESETIAFNLAVLLDRAAQKERAVQIYSRIKSAGVLRYRALVNKALALESLERLPEAQEVIGEILNEPATWQAATAAEQVLVRRKQQSLGAALAARAMPPTPSAPPQTEQKRYPAMEGDTAP